MIEKLLSKVRKIPFISSDSSFSQLIRTYLVGGFNLVFGLALVYIFQFFIFENVDVPFRTYLTNIFGFIFGAFSYTHLTLPTKMIV